MSHYHFQFMPTLQSQPFLVASASWVISVGAQLSWHFHCSVLAIACHT